MATRVDTSYTLVIDDDLVSMERGRVWGPWCQWTRWCCGSYLLVGDTHTEHKQQVDRLANAEKRRNGQKLASRARESGVDRRLRCAGRRLRCGMSARVLERKSTPRVLKSAETWPKLGWET